MAHVPKKNFLNQMYIMISEWVKSLVLSLVVFSLLLVALFAAAAIAKDSGISTS